jgi:DNA-binding CsgD family transcriptional regulator
VDASRLSESQKNCLRLVGRGMSTKEISIETGLSPQTVDTYVKTAMNRLGATNRRDAARALAQWELSQKSGSPSQALAGPAIEAEGFMQAGWKGLVQLLFPIPAGGRLHDLNAAQMTLLAIRSGITGVMLVLAIVILFLGILKVF